MIIVKEYLKNISILSGRMTRLDRRATIASTLWIPFHILEGEGPEHFIVPQRHTLEKQKISISWKREQNIARVAHNLL